MTIKAVHAAPVTRQAEQIRWPVLFLGFTYKLLWVCSETTSRLFTFGCGTLGELGYAGGPELGQQRLEGHAAEIASWSLCYSPMVISGSWR